MADFVMDNAVVAGDGHWLCPENRTISCGYLH